MYGLTTQQLVICLVLALSCVLAAVSVWRKSWPTTTQVFQLAVGAAGVYGGGDLVHFAWQSGEGITPERAIWLTMVGVGLIFVALRALWSHVLSTPPKAPLE